MKELTAGERFELYMDLEETEKETLQSVRDAINEYGEPAFIQFAFAKLLSEILGHECDLAEQEWLAKHKTGDIVRIHHEMIGEICRDSDSPVEDKVFAPVRRAVDKIIAMLERK